MSNTIINHGENFFSRLVSLQGEMTSSSLCRELGISTPLYQKWKKGSIPGYDKLRLVSEFFQRSPEWFMGRETIGMRLKEAREISGMTMDALAVQIGLDRTYLQGIENGLHPPTDGVMHKLAKALSVPLEFLKDGDRSMLTKSRAPSGPCAECAKKQAQIERLEKIIDKLMK